jgi:hypothetical protein
MNERASNHAASHTAMSDKYRSLKSFHKNHLRDKDVHCSWKYSPYEWKSCISSDKYFCSIKYFSMILKMIAKNRNRIPKKKKIDLICSYYWKHKLVMTLTLLIWINKILVGNLFLQQTEHKFKRKGIETIGNSFLQYSTKVNRNIGLYSNKRIKRFLWLTHFFLLLLT